MIEKNSFLKKYEIEPSSIESAGVEWDELTRIHIDFRGREAALRLALNSVQERLRGIHGVHSTGGRLKDPEHLIEKCIRKQVKDPNRKITLETYREEITDLIGVRALHIFKEDWGGIHRAILDTWDVKETPTANIREGDSKEMRDLYEGAECKVKIHPAGYRSVHYVIVTQPTKERMYVEVQVRTIFEEGWSEIDHMFRYPYRSHPAVATFLALFNRATGNADEMGTFARQLRDVIAAMELEQQTALREKDEIISRLENDIQALKVDRAEKERLLERANSLRSSVAGSSTVPSGIAATLAQIHHLNRIGRSPTQVILQNMVQAANPFADALRQIQAMQAVQGIHRLPASQPVRSPVGRVVDYDPRPTAPPETVVEPRPVFTTRNEGQPDPTFSPTPSSVASEKASDSKQQSVSLAVSELQAESEPTDEKPTEFSTERTPAETSKPDEDGSSLEESSGTIAHEEERSRPAGDSQ